jgi:DNA-directed RNA polymerase subunit N (RpoN/RPB10)
VGAKRDAERMRLVARLIKLQQEDHYAMEYLDYHESSFEFVPTDATEKWFTMEENITSERFEEYFAKYPRQHKRVLSGKIDRYRRRIEEKDPQIIAMEIAHENQACCRRLIFDIMHNHIERWWD